MAMKDELPRSRSMPPALVADSNHNNARDPERERARARARAHQKRLEHAKRIELRSERRLSELKQQRQQEQQAQMEKELLRKRIAPQIQNRAKIVGNNPVLLLKSFCPSLRIKNDCRSPKQIRKAFKRALASFHPDRTVNKSLRKQIEAEEIFKLLSAKKDIIVGNGNNGSGRSYYQQQQQQHYHHQQQQQQSGYYYNHNHNRNRSRGGWF